MTDDLYWDPFDADIDIDPHPLWRRIRDEQPVYRNDKFGFVALSRFEDVDAGLMDPTTYSSAHGTVLELMTPEPMQTGHIIFMDPPAQTTLRVLVSRAFTPGGSRRWRNTSGRSAPSSSTPGSAAAGSTMSGTSPPRSPPW